MWCLGSRSGLFALLLASSGLFALLLDGRCPYTTLPVVVVAIFWIFLLFTAIIAAEPNR